MGMGSKESLLELKSDLESDFVTFSGIEIGISGNWALPIPGHVGHNSGQSEDPSYVEYNQCGLIGIRFISGLGIEIGMGSKESLLELKSDLESDFVSFSGIEIGISGNRALPIPGGRGPTCLA